MRLLVFGRTGQVATELSRRAPGAIMLSREEADLSDPGACADAVIEYVPQAVINAAAYTAVDHAEEEEENAHRINAGAPAAIAKACAERRIPLVQISTDYVFDGTGHKPWRPDDIPRPINAYGRTKLAGELAVRATGGAHAILRTSWVFSPHGNNFVKTMLRLSETRSVLNVVDDQCGGPTYAGDIADACLTLAETLRASPDKSGTYHFCGSPYVSWKEFAEHIFTRNGRRITVNGIPTTDWPRPAPRPRNSRLDCAKFQAMSNVSVPDWQVALDKVLEELK